MHVKLAGSVRSSFRITVKLQIVSLSSDLNTVPLCLRSPLFFFFLVVLCHRVFCLQGVKAHGSATLSTRRQLSECLCSALT